jgi:hypothetical protein
MAQMGYLSVLQNRIIMHSLITYFFFSRWVLDKISVSQKVFVQSVERNGWHIELFLILRLAGYRWNSVCEPETLQATIFLGLLSINIP